MENKNNRVLYKVFSNCINDQKLMEPNYLKDLMKEVIRETQNIYGFEICFMEIEDNYFQVVIRRVNDRNMLSKIICRIKSVFARRYNILHERTGPFWNGRSKSKIIEEIGALN